MTAQPGQPLETVIPDLADIPADRIAELGGPGLARAIEEYRRRLKGNGIPLSSFQARI